MQVLFETEYPGLASAVVGIPGEGYLLVGSLDKGNAACGWIGGVGADGKVPWSKPLEDTDDLSSVTVAPDGTVLVCGSRWMNNRSAGWVMCIDTQGNEQWSRTFRKGEQVGSQWLWTSTHFASVHPTADGGYVAAGDKFYSAWAGDIALPFKGLALLVAKFDGQGTEEWSQVLGGTSGQGAQACSIEATADGGYVVVGYRGEGPYLVKLTPTGQTEWSWPSGDQAGGSLGLLESVCLAQDGSYVACGYTGDEALLIRLDTEGNLIRLKTFGLPQRSDGASAVVATPDGNLLLCGSTSLPDDTAETAVTPQAWLRKVDLNGNELWVKTYAGNPGCFISVIVTADGGYAAAGYTYPSDEEMFPWLIKMDPDGN